MFEYAMLKAKEALDIRLSQWHNAQHDFLMEKVIKRRIVRAYIMRGVRSN